MEQMVLFTATGSDPGMYLLGVLKGRVGGAGTLLKAASTLHGDRRGLEPRALHQGVTIATRPSLFPVKI